MSLGSQRATEQKNGRKKGRNKAERRGGRTRRSAGLRFCALVHAGSAPYFPFKPFISFLISPTLIRSLKLTVETMRKWK